MTAGELAEGDWGWGVPSGRTPCTNVITRDIFIRKNLSFDNHSHETRLYHHSATKWRDVVNFSSNKLIE